jgi:hypothetical protein
MDEKPLVRWFPDDHELALKVSRNMGALRAEDELPAAEFTQTFGSQTLDRAARGGSE